MDLFGTMDADISPCETFRWSLTRRWSGGPRVLWLMLNPSTADGSKDDPTLLRIVGFSKRWGFGGLVVANLHPFRSPHPDVLRRWLAAGVGTEEASRRNAEVWRELAAASSMAVAAWGAHGDRALARTLLGKSAIEIRCLGRTNDGSPIHPLARGRSRVPDDATAIPFDLAA